MGIADDIARIDAEIKITTDLFRIFNGDMPEGDPLAQAWERVKQAARSSEIKPMAARPHQMSPQEYALASALFMAECPEVHQLVPLRQLFTATGIKTKGALRVVISSLRVKVGPKAAKLLTTRWGQGFVVAPGFYEAWQQHEREKHD